MESLITIAALIVVSSVSAFAVLHQAFNDSLIQRVCLTGFCFGALGLAWGLAHGGEVSDSMFFGSVLAAVWGVESIRKAWR